MTSSEEISGHAARLGITGENERELHGLAPRPMMQSDEEKYVVVHPQFMILESVSISLMKLYAWLNRALNQHCNLDEADRAQFFPLFMANVRKYKAISKAVTRVLSTALTRDIIDDCVLEDEEEQLRLKEKFADQEDQSLLQCVFNKVFANPEVAAMYLDHDLQKHDLGGAGGLENYFYQEFVALLNCEAYTEVLEYLKHRVYQESLERFTIQQEEGSEGGGGEGAFQGVRRARKELAADMLEFGMSDVRELFNCLDPVVVLTAEANHLLITVFEDVCSYFPNVYVLREFLKWTSGELLGLFDELLREGVEAFGLEDIDPQSEMCMTSSLVERVTEVVENYYAKYEEVVPVSSAPSDSGDANPEDTKCKERQMPSVAELFAKLMLGFQHAAAGSSELANNRDLVAFTKSFEFLKDECDLLKKIVLAKGQHLCTLREARASDMAEWSANDVLIWCADVNLSELTTYKIYTDLKAGEESQTGSSTGGVDTAGERLLVRYGDATNYNMLFGEEVEANHTDDLVALHGLLQAGRQYAAWRAHVEETAARSREDSRRDDSRNCGSESDDNSDGGDSPGAAGPRVKTEDADSEREELAKLNGLKARCDTAGELADAVIDEVELELQQAAENMKAIKALSPDTAGLAEDEELTGMKVPKRRSFYDGEEIANVGDFLTALNKILPQRVQDIEEMKGPLGATGKSSATSSASQLGRAMRALTLADFTALQENTPADVFELAMSMLETGEALENDDNALLLRFTVFCRYLLEPTQKASVQLQKVDIEAAGEASAAPSPVGAQNLVHLDWNIKDVEEVKRPAAMKKPGQQKEQQKQMTRLVNDVNEISEHASREELVAQLAACKNIINDQAALIDTLVAQLDDKSSKEPQDEEEEDAVSVVSEFEQVNVKAFGQAAAVEPATIDPIDFMRVKGAEAVAKKAKQDRMDMQIRQVYDELNRMPDTYTVIKASELFKLTELYAMREQLSATASPTLVAAASLDADARTSMATAQPAASPKEFIVDDCATASPQTVRMTSVAEQQGGSPMATTFSAAVASKARGSENFRASQISEMAKLQAAMAQATADSNKLEAKALPSPPLSETKTVTPGLEAMDIELRPPSTSKVPQLTASAEKQFCMDDEEDDADAAVNAELDFDEGQNQLPSAVPFPATVPSAPGSASRFAAPQLLVSPGVSQSQTLQSQPGNSSSQTTMTVVAAAVTKAVQRAASGSPQASPESSPAPSPASETMMEACRSPDLRKYSIGNGNGVNAFKPKPFPKLQLNLDAPKVANTGAGGNGSKAPGFVGGLRSPRINPRALSPKTALEKELLETREAVTAATITLANPALVAAVGGESSQHGGEPSPTESQTAASTTRSGRERTKTVPTFDARVRSMSPEGLTNVIGAFAQHNNNRFQKAAARTREQQMSRTLAMRNAPRPLVRRAAQGVAGKVTYQQGTPLLAKAGTPVLMRSPMLGTSASANTLRGPGSAARR